MTNVCYCGYHLPRVKVLLAHGSPATAFRVIVECPECGREFSRDMHDGETLDEPHPARVNATGGTA